MDYKIFIIIVFIGINNAYAADVAQPTFEGKVTYEQVDDLLRKGALSEDRKTMELFSACKRGDPDMVELLLQYDTKFKDFEIKPLERLFKKNQKELEQTKGVENKALQNMLAGQFQCIDLLKKYKQAPIWEKNLIKAVEAGEDKKVKKLLEEGKDFFYKLHNIIQIAKGDIREKMERDKKFVAGAPLYENVKEGVKLVQNELTKYQKARRESFAQRSGFQLNIYANPSASATEGSSGTAQNDPIGEAPLSNPHD